MSYLFVLVYLCSSNVKILQNFTDHTELQSIWTPLVVVYTLQDKWIVCGNCHTKRNDTTWDISFHFIEGEKKTKNTQMSQRVPNLKDDIFKNYSWHDPVCINHRTQHMFNHVYPEQTGGWGEALLITMNQQFAGYPDSSTTSTNPMPSSAEIVPPTATKTHTLTHIKTPSCSLNHYLLTLFTSSVYSHSAWSLFRRNH